MENYYSKKYPVDHVKKIRSSRMVDNWEVQQYLNQIKKNKFAVAWVLIPRILLGIHDTRPRRGTFNTPWNALSNPLYAMPELKFINDKMSDLLDERAMELYNEAKNSNKKLAVMWSGGIDSTAVLVSLLKNIPNNEHDMIEVIMTTSSIYENVNFYFKHISNKLKQKNYIDIKLDVDFLDQYILLHGDPADCLFGPNMPSSNNQTVKNYESSGIHLKLHSIHKINIKHPLLSTYQLGFDFNQWYYDKINQTIQQAGQSDYVSTVADFWWWQYFNFKWEFSCQRPFFYMRSLQQDSKRMPMYKKSIPHGHQEQFAKNTFFNTDKFQQWSYTNLKNLIPKDVSQHKIDLKKYVYEFDHNEIYFSTKTKVGTKTPVHVLRTVNVNGDSTVNPLYYDDEWVGHAWNEDDHRLSKTSRMLLDRYAG